MLKKRLLVLAVLLCSLGFVASNPASAALACSCAATSCTRCEALCDTLSDEDIARAWDCCYQAWDATFPGCEAAAPTTIDVVTKEENP